MSPECQYCPVFQSSWEQLVPIKSQIHCVSLTQMKQTFNTRTQNHITTTDSHSCILTSHLLEALLDVSDYSSPMCPQDIKSALYSQEMTALWLRLCIRWSEEGINRRLSWKSSSQESQCWWVWGFGMLYNNMHPPLGKGWKEGGVTHGGRGGVREHFRCKSHDSVWALHQDGWREGEAARNFSTNERSGIITTAAPC